MQSVNSSLSQLDLGLTVWMYSISHRNILGLNRAVLQSKTNKSQQCNNVNGNSQETQTGQGLQARLGVAGVHHA